MTKREGKEHKREFAKNQLNRFQLRKGRKRLFLILERLGIVTLLGLVWKYGLGST